VRFLRCLLGFLFGLGGTALVLYRFLPRGDEAFDQAFAAAATCNVLFVGPSYVKVGLDPEVFEAETRELGHPLEVCKFTRSALRSYELQHDLRLLMRHRWPALRRVVVDITLNPRELEFDRENWFNPRLVHWHTWDALSWLRAHYRAQRKEWREIAPLALAHLEHVAMNYFSVGRAGTLLRRARWVERRLGTQDREAMAPEVDRLPRARREDKSDEERKLVTLQLSRDKAAGRARRAYESDAWPRELESIIVAAGYQPVFLYSPVYVRRMPPRPAAPGKARRLVFFDFDDPDRYPQLYETEARGHTSHLSDEGAKRWSRILAREMVKLPDEPDDRGRRSKRKHDESDEP
jgi:hypothetical protein